MTQPQPPSEEDFHHRPGKTVEVGQCQWCGNSLRWYETADGGHVPLMRWYRQRCPDHATSTSPDAAPSELTPYDLVRHSHYILGERPHEYDNCRTAADRRRRTTQSRWRTLATEHTHPTRHTRPGQHGVDTVLSAIPAPVIRALGGTLPPDLVALAHDELETRTAAELVDRIERLWGAHWANARLRRNRS